MESKWSSKIEEILDTNFAHLNAFYLLKDTIPLIKVFCIKLAEQVEQETISTLANEDNHPDAFYESNTWWIPKESILNAKLKL